MSKVTSSSQPPPPRKTAESHSDSQKPTPDETAFRLFQRIIPLLPHPSGFLGWGGFIINLFTSSPSKPASKPSTKPATPPVSLHTLVTQKDERGIARYLQSAGMSKAVAKKIALKMAPLGASWYEQNLSETQRKKLFDSAGSILSAVAYHEDSEITDTYQTALIELARLCAQHRGGAVISCIYKWGITDQTALIEIARLCARQDGGTTAAYIRKFGITDPKALRSTELFSRIQELLQRQLF